MLNLQKTVFVSYRSGHPCRMFEVCPGESPQSLQVTGAADSPAKLGDVQIASRTSRECKLHLHHVVCRTLSMDAWQQAA